MGKSATAKMFAERGVPVYDADRTVHTLYARGGAGVDPIGKLFPNVIIDGAVSRPALRDIVLNNPEDFTKLNRIIHPLVGQTQIVFRQQAKENQAPLAVLDIPLLFETDGNKACDYVAVVTAPSGIQRNRVLARNTMSEAEFETILAKQTPDHEKRAKADFIISTAFGFAYAKAHVEAIIELFTNFAQKELSDG